MVNTKTEKITAQNSTNQSLYLGIFTEDDLAKFAKKFEGSIVHPNYFINVMKAADRILAGGRMPEDKKAIIRMGYGLLSSLVRLD